MKCILCNSEKLVEVGTIDNEKLCNLYKKRSNTNVNHFFKEKETSILKCADCDLTFYSPSAIGDGKFYDDLQKYKDYYMDEKSEFTEAAKFINENDEVLEIGCGKGVFPSYIKYKSYTGLEFSSEAIKLAQAKKLNVSNQSLENHATNNPEKYDVVCYFQVLEHVDHPNSFIQHSLNTIKKGGKLILAVPSEDSFIKDATNFYLNMPPHHTAKWTDKSLNQIATLFNLKLIHIYHEPLIEANTEIYIKTKINLKIHKLFGIKTKSVDTSFLNNLIYAASVIITHIFKYFINTKDVTGQSVMVVYEKK